MTTLVEATAGQLTEATAAPASGALRYRARIIEGDRWGSSGYYSREVLERDGPATFPAGTHVYFDHPTQSDRFERPERSVRDLAGRIDSTPVYETDGLYADLEVYPHAAPVVEAMSSAIGLSIRASGDVEEGERDGRRGPIVKSLSEGLSVDLVTRAGAGGRLVSLMESAREGAAQAVQAALQETTFATTAGNGHHFVPVNAAGTGTTTESVGGHSMPELTESAEITALREAAGRVTTLEAERNAATARAETAERRLAETEARTAATTRARARVLEANGTLAAGEVDFIVEAATTTIPLTDDGQLDEAAADLATDTARTRVETMLAQRPAPTQVTNVYGLPGVAESRTDIDAALNSFTESAFGPSPYTTSREG
jgi:hypothetical protein